MNLGFYIILAAQFFSALADNALLFAAIALLQDHHAPSWYTPVLQQVFVVSFILLAPFVGAFADSLPKGRVMFISNAIKFIGCVIMLVGAHPLPAYALVGLGAATYSPAKYGILTEYLPPEKLVLANSWMEGLTVIAIILGAVISGILLKPEIADPLLHWWNMSLIHTPPELAILIIATLYLVAAAFNLHIPRLPVAHKPGGKSPVFLIGEFAHNFRLLWKDPLGQVSLAVTTLFWGAGATLRLLVMAWAFAALHYDTSASAVLTAWVAVGIAAGAALAARFVRLEHSVKVLPFGIAMGALVLLLIPTGNPILATPMCATTSALCLLIPNVNSILATLILIAIGVMSGYFVVPMNALLQHRGHLLMGSGSSIAVQNFNENLSIFGMLALYALMDKLEFHINLIILFFGLLLAGIMTVLYRLHGHDQDAGEI